MLEQAVLSHIAEYRPSQVTEEPKNSELKETMEVILPTA